MKTRFLSALAGTMIGTAALASSVNFVPVASVTFSNKNSIDAQGDLDNARDMWVATGGGTISGVRVTGSLTEINTATFANEARVRMTAGAGNTFTGFNLQASTVGGFTGTLAVGPTTIPVTPFSLSSGGTVNFEWFESFQDGTAGLPESRWDTVTYEFGSSAIVNGNFSLGTQIGDGSVSSSNGSNVAGGLDFYTFTLGTGVLNVGDYLNIQTIAQQGGSTAYDSELAIYDSNGNLVATDDDGGATGLFSFLSFGASDPNAGGGSDAAGADGATLAAGAYTIVVGGFDTIFGANINSITPGSAAGTYALRVQTVPTPGAAAVLGLGGLLIARRRRA